MTERLKPMTFNKRLVYSMHVVPQQVKRRFLPSEKRGNLENEDHYFIHVHRLAVAYNSVKQSILVQRFILHFKPLQLKHCLSHPLLWWRFPLFFSSCCMFKELELIAIQAYSQTKIDVRQVVYNRQYNQKLYLWRKNLESLLNLGGGGGVLTD